MSADAFLDCAVQVVQTERQKQVRLYHQMDKIIKLNHLTVVYRSEDQVFYLLCIFGLVYFSLLLKSIVYC